MRHVHRGRARHRHDHRTSLRPGIKPTSGWPDRCIALNSIDTIGTLPNYPIGDDSVTLLCLPLFHTFGLNFGAGLTFGFGLTMVLVDRFDPELVFSLIEEHKVTLFWGVPPNVEKIMDL